MLTHFPATLVFLFTLPILAQQALVPAARQTAPASKQLTVEDVIAMAQAGLSDEVIIARLRKEERAFDLSPQELIRLKSAKVNDAVLKVMMDPKGGAPAPIPQQPAIQIPMIPRIGAAGRSGATPSPGADASGDLNDPLTPHDSGIYLYSKDREGKPEMVVLERAAYEGAKTGGMLASAMTYGIKKMKTRAVLPGPHAGVRVSEPSPVFYFYFDDKQAGLGRTYFGISSLSNPNQFVLLKLEVKKSDRETVIGQYSALGMSSGSDANATIPFKSERIRAGLYKVVVNDLKGGEYCFLASNGITSTGIAAAYGVGVTNSADIFDFGVSVD